VDLHAAVVFDEPEFAKLVEEETDSGASRSYHFGQRLSRFSLELKS
jgi:hypothetical protein